MKDVSLSFKVCYKFILMKEGRDICYLFIIHEATEIRKDALGLELVLINLLDMRD